MKKTLLGSLLAATLATAPSVLAEAGNQAFIGSATVNNPVEIEEGDYTLDGDPVSGTLHRLSISGVVVTELPPVGPVTKGSNEITTISSNSTRINNAVLIDSVLSENEKRQGWLAGVVTTSEDDVLVVAYKKPTKKNSVGEIRSVDEATITPSDSGVVRSWRLVENSKSQSGSLNYTAYTPVSWTILDIGGTSIADYKSSASSNKNGSKFSDSWKLQLRGVSAN